MIPERLLLVLGIVALAVLITVMLIARQRRKWRDAHDSLTGIVAPPSSWRFYNWRYSSTMVQRRTEELGGDDE